MRGRRRLGRRTIAGSEDRRGCALALAVQLLVRRVIDHGYGGGGASKKAVARRYHSGAWQAGSDGEVTTDLLAAPKLPGSASGRQQVCLSPSGSCPQSPDGDRLSRVLRQVVACCPDRRRLESLHDYSGSHTASSSPSPSRPQRAVAMECAYLALQRESLAAVRGTQRIAAFFVPDNHFGARDDPHRPTQQGSAR